MAKYHLMKRIDMNRNYPDSGPGEIPAYLGTAFVLIDESGNIVPLMKKGFGDSYNFNEEVVQGLLRIQNKGGIITGEVHSFFREAKDIQGDTEHYAPFSRESSQAEYLLKRGIDIKFSSRFERQS